jgi:hypothetical protein
VSRVRVPGRSARLRRFTATAAALMVAGPLAVAPAAAAPSPTPSSPGSTAPGSSSQGSTATEVPLPSFPAVPVGDPCEGTSEDDPVAVLVETLTPRAPTAADEAFEVTGTLTHCGLQPLDRLQVRLLVGRKIDSRSGLAQAAERPVLGSRALDAVTPERDELSPGASTPFAVRVEVGDLALGRENGVFPLAVQVRAVPARSRSRQSVGVASTFVPWFPDGPIAPTRIAWLLPLVDTPRRGPDGVLLDPRLEESLGAAPLSPTARATGRLARVLAAAVEGARGACDAVVEAPVEPAPPLPTAPDVTAPGAPSVPVPPEPCRGDPVPLTYAVDPDLLTTVQALTEPHRAVEEGEVVEHPPSEVAVQWLASVRQATREGDVLALPYADPDVIALSRPESGVRDDVDLLRKLGQSEARRVLEVDDLLTSIAFPPPGPIGGALDTLVGESQGGLPPAIVLSDESTEPATGARTPGARTTLSSTTGPVTALIVDPALSALVEPDPENPSWQGARLAEQRWIAESAVLAAERPSESRTFVVAPPRRADLLPAVAAPVIADTGRLPWLCPVDLAAVAVGTEGCATLPDGQEPGASEERDPPTSAERATSVLSPAFVDELADVRRFSDQLTDEVLLPSSEEAKATKTRLLKARGRAASSAWRDSPAQGRRMLGLLRAEVDALRDQVSLLSKPVLLTGSSGTMRLTVENTLRQPVRIGVRLDDTSETRLSSEDTGVREIPANRAVDVSVRVEARTSGRFVARARLVDASGDPFGPPVELAVRSTQYGRVALGITGVAAAVLLVAAGMRITRRALSRSRSGASS